MKATLNQRRLELKYLVMGVLLTTLLFICSTQPFFTDIETGLFAALETMMKFGLVGLFVIAFFSNLVVIINIPFMVVALPWVVANPSPVGIVLFSLITGVGAGLGKLITYTLASRVTAQFETLSASPLHGWISTQIERRPRFAPALVFLAAGTILPLDPALMPLLLVGYPARNVAAPLISGKMLQSLSLALLMVLITSSLGMGGGVNVDLTFGVILGTLLLMAYQVEKTRQSGTTAPAQVTA
ncbi:MAG: hypothetical protein JXQ72_04350 [Anaerolineae bacterium]|nr:hypothetical protein [Anaerolineae bacterium]